MGVLDLFSQKMQDLGRLTSYPCCTDVAESEYIVWHEEPLQNVKLPCRFVSSLFAPETSGTARGTGAKPKGPKSMSFAGASGSGDTKRIFSGLMSRWMMPRS